MFEPLESRQLLAVIPVTTNVDGDPGSLRDAIDTANSTLADDIITLPADTYVLDVIGAGDDTNASGDLDIFDRAVAGTLTIQGAGAGSTTIDGFASDRVFHLLAGASLTVEGVTVRNGSVSGLGGGIFSDQGILTVDQSIVAENIAETGGGIAVDNGQLSVTNSEITNNDALGGPSVDGRGGGISAVIASPIVVTDSIISGNEARGGEGANGLGGGIYSKTGTWNVFTGNQVSNNDAVGGNDAGAGAGAGRGGGIYSETSTWTVFSTSTASLNVAQGGSSDLATGGPGDGGGIYSSTGETWSITRSTFNDNQAVGGNGEPVSGTGGQARGGAAVIDTSSWTVQNSTFSFNSATGGAGGGLGGNGTGGAIELFNAGLVISYSTIADNSANAGAPGGSGSAGGVNAAFGGVTTTANIFAKNSASTAANDILGNFASIGYNFVGDSTTANWIPVPGTGDQLGTTAAPLDPKLGPLDDNGGPTFTRALTVGSTAIDAAEASPAISVPTDQRGVERPDGDNAIVGTADIGAYEGFPDIQIVKDVSVDGGNTFFTDSDPIPSLLESGGDPVFRYTVTTGIGNEPITGVVVSDSVLGTIPGPSSGDNMNGILEPGETWVYLATGNWMANSQTNTGTVTGLGKGQQVTDQDDATYFGAVADIAIEKLVSVDGGVTYVPADDPPFPTLPSGGPDPMYRFDVTIGTGNVGLINVVVNDPSLGGNIPGPTNGDDTDGVLEPGETWEYFAIGMWAVGEQTNTATAFGEYTDDGDNLAAPSASDSATYVGEEPMGGEGCTPGFWKTHSIYGPAPEAGWADTDYYPDDFVNEIFGTTFPDNPTLLEALSTGGGGVNALMRHAVAALLNASNDHVSYFYTEPQVIQMTVDALALGGDAVEDTKDLFEYQNELGCDLSPNTGNPPPAEPMGASIQGIAWVDSNSNGQVDPGEPAIENVTVTLIGNDVDGNPVMLSQVTDGDGVYLFDELPPSDADGYVITQVQPTGFDNDREYAGQINGTAVADDGDVYDDMFTVALAADDVAENFNFAEQISDHTGTYLESSLTATIGFWQNPNGQSLIESLNGGASSTQLGDWLAGSFPELYGTTSDGLAGKNNAEVAAYFKSIFKAAKGKKSDTGPAKVDPQVMAVALAVYVTDRGLAGGPVAEAYGFSTFEPTPGEDPGMAGLGGRLFDIDEAAGTGTAETLFGVGTPSVLTVMDILSKTSDNSSDGVVFEDPDDGDSAIDVWEAALRSLANDLFTSINESGDI
jgi:hypothetical protein